MKEYRDNRLYMNSDKQPKKGDVVINCGQAHEVKGVSKDGHKLFIVGWAYDMVLQYWMLKSFYREDSAITTIRARMVY